MNTKKTPEKVTAMFSLKRYLKNKADERLALLQHREAKRQAKPEAILAAKKLAKANTLITVEEGEHDHSQCDHDHSHE
jgi:hypothetical protein